MSNPMRQGNRQHTFYIKSGNYAKHMQTAIKSELSDELPWKEQLIWTISKFDFKGSKYSQITLIVQEFGSQLTFRTPDDGIAYILTVPELADTAPPRKKWLGIF
jgi:hypothetical protein